MQPTDTEYQLLFELSVNAGVVLSYEELLEGSGKWSTPGTSTCPGGGEPAVPEARRGCEQPQVYLHRSSGRLPHGDGGGTGAGYHVKVAAWRPVTGSVVSGRPVPVGLTQSKDPRCASGGLRTLDPSMERLLVLRRSRPPGGAEPIAGHTTRVKVMEKALDFIQNGEPRDAWGRSPAIPTEVLG